MSNILKTKLGKEFKLLVKTVKTQPTLYLSALLFIVIFITSILKTQDLFINLLASFIVTFVGLLVDTRIKYRRFVRLEGVYDAFLYESEDGRILKTDSIGKYVVCYEGGSVISIRKTESLIEAAEDELWEGEAEISDSNLGTLYWQYISPEKLRDLVGYKKIIIPKQNIKEIKIYLIDESILSRHREVLVKQSNE